MAVGHGLPGQGPASMATPTWASYSEWCSHRRLHHFSPADNYDADMDLRQTKLEDFDVWLT
jgi:hypothetical protein